MSKAPGIKIFAVSHLVRKGQPLPSPSLCNLILVINQLNAQKFVLFIIWLYMFRALCAHHQEVRIVLYSIWYHHTCRWPSGAQVGRGLCTGRPDEMIPDAV